jgi:hypothetical protein
VFIPRSCTTCSNMALGKGGEGGQTGDAGHVLFLHYVLVFALQLSKSQEITAQATEECRSQFLV